MKIEVAKEDARMAPAGKALLRSLSNETLPLIDLVVRESFQNSLDAKLPNQNEIRVDVNIQDVDTRSISPIFGGVENRLNSLFPTSSTVISIRDVNTTGLTGTYKTSNRNELEKSNIYKLIYGINMNQEQSDAGGSWGLGKTSFFRIGAGIVIYYTRIKIGLDTFEERLAACLIENSDSKNAILPQYNRGVAWWGQKESSNIHDRTYPITNPEAIKSILEALKVQPYVKHETGTTIIIPFVQEKHLVFEDNEARKTEEEVYYWEKDMAESFELAIKRWYFPRLMNIHYEKHFKQPYLIAAVNNAPVFFNKKDDIFSYFRKLYDGALLGKSREENIKVREVFLKQMGMKKPTIPIGYLSYIKVSAKDLGMETRGALSPLAYLGVPDSSNHTSGKVLAYCRKPGMVIEYITDNKDWLSGFNVEDNRFVFAMFVPNSDGKLHERYATEYPTLENFLRSTEYSDHSTWNDKRMGKKNITIVSRLKKEVARILTSEFGEKLETNSSNRTSALSRKFGQVFLPKANFGRSGSTPKKKVSKKKTISKPSSSISLKNFEHIDRNHIRLDCNLRITKKTSISPQINVSSIDKEITMEEWENTFENTIPFPFVIEQVEIEEAIGVEINDEDWVVNNSNTIREVPTRLNVLIKDSSFQPSLSIRSKKIEVGDNK
ncbi:hypothetical protein ACWOA0_07920 [Ignavigranum ruoffiae]